MNESEYFQVFVRYRAFSVEELGAELRTLRRMMKGQQLRPHERRNALQYFGVAWHVFEEKGGDIKAIFPTSFNE